MHEISMLTQLNSISVPPQRISNTDEEGDCVVASLTKILGTVLRFQGKRGRRGAEAETSLLSTTMKN